MCEVMSIPSSCALTDGEGLRQFPQVVAPHQAAYPPVKYARQQSRAFFPKTYRHPSSPHLTRRDGGWGKQENNIRALAEKMVRCRNTHPSEGQPTRGDHGPQLRSAAAWGPLDSTVIVFCLVLPPLVLLEECPVRADFTRAGILHPAATPRLPPVGAFPSTTAEILSPRRSGKDWAGRPNSGPGGMGRN